ncbi:DUF3306 domain-containing protein [Ovoidimarina sediminis]|uniref:DUF3306 domain-containing protein n=1 Tax=Ovoidimarina sediminis TaxID=3079856 RepID=UPI002913079A|nr:DUF3306 domain-containing protein [Rhodophyticola sp. MJ-SS7]MDU8942054.1 DUF3306 domain-containing protein [Rhodophyticola sp. MJ-SS7]
MTDGSDGFLSRWSRRKRGAVSKEPEPARPSPGTERAVATEPTGAAPRPPESESLPPPEPEKPEEEAEILARLGLPDPATLQKGDDFQPFMQAGVPEFLRRKALRRLWRSNPTLAVLDGLNDYDDDFTGGFVPPGTLKTLYEVGKGLVSQGTNEMQESARPETQPEKNAGAQDTLNSANTRAPDAPGENDDARSTEPEAGGAGEDITPSEQAAARDAPEPQDETPRPTRRRMTFTLPEA